MDKIESDLRTFCFQAPRWMLLELQAFWYGLISWSITCSEDLLTPDPKLITVRDLLIHSDGEFEDWPTEWLEPYIHEYISLNPTLMEHQEYFGLIEELFQDCIPTDLNIFSVLVTGEILLEEQWERLYDSIAFTNPIIVEEKRQIRTRRVHGRRGITPIKARRAFTRHKITIIKKDN
jgi:hypothetical protein